MTTLEAPMSWARFDDNYTDHPKIVEAGHLAELLDMRAIIYSARHDTDGLITPAALKAIGRQIPRVHEKVDRLVTVGRWSTNPGGGWLVHDFLESNMSKAQREDQRAAGRRRAARFVARHSPTNGVSNAFLTEGSSRGGEGDQLGVGGAGGGDGAETRSDAAPLDIAEQQRRIRELGAQLRQRRRS